MDAAGAPLARCAETTAGRRERSNRRHRPRRESLHRRCQARSGSRLRVDRNARRIGALLCRLTQRGAPRHLAAPGPCSSDEAHPMGHGRERFLWAFLAAIASFLIGGCLSVGLAIRALERRQPTGHALVAWIVLAISFAADGASWLRASATRDGRRRTMAWACGAIWSAPAIRWRGHVVDEARRWSDFCSRPAGCWPAISPETAFPTRSPRC